MTTNFEDLAQRYIATWNETDPQLRRKGIDALWATDARYTDPLADVEGRDGIDAMIAAVQDRFPGMRFSLAGPVDGHHEQVRFSWELGPDNGPTTVEAPIAGFDVATTDHNGQLARVFGFLDRVPSG